jgi:putative membrane protein
MIRLHIANNWWVQMNLKNFSSDPVGLASFLAYLALLAAMGYGSLNLNTTTLFIVSSFMFVTCALSACHLFGARPALQLLALAIGIGFFAEYMGENYGWFFGDYDFTDALGPRVLGVPIVIPMVWFNLSYIGFVLSNLLLYRAPIDAEPKGSSIFLASIIGSMLVTAYDLGIDPYMVFVAKAWIMEKTDGWWFGETLQGFVGWFSISFLIGGIFRYGLARQNANRPQPGFKKVHALLPLLVYLNFMFFQMLYGKPVETRTIAFFAMGFPLMIAFFTWRNWSWTSEKRAV